MLFSSWKFNTTSVIMDLPRSSFMEHGNFSVLSYQAQSEMDYGSVLCWAQNELGKQRKPCIFHLMPAGKDHHYQKTFLSSGHTHTRVLFISLPCYYLSLQYIFGLGINQALFLGHFSLTHKQQFSKNEIWRECFFQTDINILSKDCLVTPGAECL